MRFEDFEADLLTGELRKQGIKLKFGGQPFQLLAMLLEKPGEVVTREEIRQRFWPDATVVEFDHSINIAANRIRAVVGGGPNRDAAGPRLSFPGDGGIP